jgi:hypothetical protein
MAVQTKVPSGSVVIPVGASQQMVNFENVEPFRGQKNYISWSEFFFIAIYIEWKELISFSHSKTGDCLPSVAW